MSLEKTIEANTKAIEALTAKLTAAGLTVTAAPAAVTPAAPAGGAALPPKQAAEAEQRKKPVTATEAVGAGVVGNAITFESLKTKVLALAAKDEAKATEIMKKYGGKLPATKPEDYPALDLELDAALAPAAAAPAGSLV